MLDGRREQAVGGEFLPRARAIRIAHGERRWPLDLDAHVRNGETPFLVHPHFAAERDDLRIDHGDRLLLILLVGDVEDQQAARHADLHGSEPHARRRVHGFQHVVDELVQLAVHAFDRRRRLTEQGIGQDDDRKFGHGAQIGNTAVPVNCHSGGSPILWLIIW